MIQWYLSIKNLLRSIEQKALDAIPLYQSGGKEASSSLNKYISTDYEQLWDVWKQKYPDESLGNLGRHIHFGMDNDYRDIVNNDLPEIEKRADTHLLNSVNKETELGELGFENLLHPIIYENSYQLFRNGHYREGVLNSITALFDFIRTRSKTDDDGDRLIGKVFSLNEPTLIFSEIDSESGQNDQKGFMQILKGAYQGIRNPKAHSLSHDLTYVKAAQYLIFASLLARRIDEALLKDDY